jgi:hypothetical protein
MAWQLDGKAVMAWQLDGKAVMAWQKTIAAI